MKKTAKTKKPTKAKKSASRTKTRTKAAATAYYAQSKRLEFRLIEAGDEALYYGLFTDAKNVKHFCAPLSAEKAKQSFAKALAVSAVKPLKQRITSIVDKGSKKTIGIASIRLVDPVNRIAEVGILLKPNAQAQRFATEASLALINSAFRWHTIDGITAQVAVGHKVGERLVKTLGYARGADIAPSGDCGPRTSWSIGRESWAASFK
jgi:RimJ/RimL family protein N-acetyltransferase